MSTPEMGQTLAQNNDQLMAGWMAQVICVTLRGVISCFPQERVEKVLILFAAICGQQLAQAYGGDEFNVLKLRKAMKDNFAKALSETPITAIAKPKMADTASIGGS